MTRTPTGFDGIAMNPDEIEQRVIRAYIQLVYTPETDGTRMVTVAQIGALEARLMEIPEAQVLPGLPSCWLELYSHAKCTVVDSCGCNELDEDELDRAVELIASAQQRVRDLH
ncbi:hypothetical protein FHR70_004039 [Microvirga lupini]|uniref:Uncharacterized protein n=1 Tax=Microvirga lupini TaxID=420324 RepID=A0A7W4VPQ5_9HYPH|nr:hypothetical protein [Microvirga lupini]MBB3020951.1 hypothetical protein [Microvirga lupini]